MRRARAHAPVRLLTAVPICDGHDSTINTLNLELIRHGVEVIYLGYHRSAADIARAAVQEDVAAIGISSYNGGHVEFFTAVLTELKNRGAPHIELFGGGGGTITRHDAALMKRLGVTEIFFPGATLDQITTFITARYTNRPKPPLKTTHPDAHLARQLTRAEQSPAPSRHSVPSPQSSALVLGIAGPGGSGKTTLIDELVLRALNHDPKSRIAILSHDPTIVGQGALLGDRATMIYSQNDRVFMRSLATRGAAGGLSAATSRALDTILSNRSFNLVLIETVGVGQEAQPFAKKLVDKTIYLTSPDYGSRLQLQKIALLDLADIVVINKSDLPGAATAHAELEQRLAPRIALRGNARLSPPPALINTIAKHHRNPGIDRLFDLIITNSLAWQRKALSPRPHHAGAP